MKRFIFFVSILSFNPAFSQVKRVFHFDSFMDGVAVLEDGQNLNIWGFEQLLPVNLSKQLPSPTIYCELGDTVEIILDNTSLEAHTIHLHGLDVDQANDGVPSTSFFVQPGQQGSYSFIAKYPGNYLYHCHVTSVLHVQMGMYGMLIVAQPGGIKELFPGGPKYNREYSWLGADIDKSWHDDYTTIGSFVNFEPDYFQISGKGGSDLWSDSSLSIYGARINEPLLFRIFNVGFGSQTYYFPSSMDAYINSSDGRFVPQVLKVDSLVVYPGERFSVLGYPNTMAQDSIRIDFRDLKEAYWGSQNIPFEVNGVFGIDPLNTASKIHPNPNSGKFDIKFPNSVVFKSLQVFDSKGQVCWESQFPGEYIGREYEVDLSLAPGLYYLRIRALSGDFFQRLIISK